MLIRPLTSADADAVWEIFTRVVAGRDTYAFTPWTARDEGVGYWIGPGITAYAAELDGAVAGIYKLIENRRGLGCHVANASFMVHPEASGRGLGYALGQHCLQEARRQGYDAMQFNYVVSTNTRAVRLWQRLGFAIVGTVPRAYQHGTRGLVDVYVMHRFLDDILLTFGSPMSDAPVAKRPCAYAVLANAGALAVVHAQEGILLPGGGIDRGEAAADAVVREVAEECALQIDLGGVLGAAIQFVYSNKHGTQFEKHSSFVAGKVRGSLARTPEHRTEWLEATEAAHTVTYASHAWAIRRWQRLNT